jgi:NAD(P)-dependent dehydrogenase (short-subunit alcohol dehydrogenase family)
MAGKICLVTGANSGIGRETVLGLAGHGAHVVMVCRNSKRGEMAREAIIQESGNSDVDLLLADLSSMQEVRDLGERLIKRYEHLHVLVNNAGLFGVGLRRTVDGSRRRSR